MHCWQTSSILQISQKGWLHSWHFEVVFRREPVAQLVQVDGLLHVKQVEEHFEHLELFKYYPSMQDEHTLAEEQDLHVKLVEHCWHVSPFCVK